MKQHNAVIVGYGGMGRYHYQELCKTERICYNGVYDIDQSRMELAKEDGIETMYSSFEDAIADPNVELVLISTPNNFHMDLTCAALRAGKAVICEKPVAMSSDELQIMMDTAKETGSLFTIHQNRRRDADFLEMRRVVEQGLLGKVFEIESRVIGSRGIPEGWRQYTVAGGGMMLDWGVHLIDQIMYMLPGRVKTVYCELFHVNYSECDDGFKLFLTFEDGPSAMVEVGTSHYIKAPRWYVNGDRGGLTIPDWDCNGVIIHAKDRDVTWEEEIVYTKAGPTKTMAPRSHDTVEEIVIDGTGLFADYDAYYRNIADVLDGVAAPAVLPEEAMRVMRVMEAAFESDRTHQAVCGSF